MKLDLKPSTTQLRQFGWIALFGFPIVSVLILWNWLDWQPNAVIYTLWGLAAVCGLLALTVPSLLNPLYVLMMVVAFPIGFVLSHILLRLIYYLVFTPMALIFKLKGRDAMNRKLEPERDSYWEDHKDVAQPRSPASYLRLY